MRIKSIFDFTWFVYTLRSGTFLGQPRLCFLYTHLALFVPASDRKRQHGCLNTADVKIMSPVRSKLCKNKGWLTFFWQVDKVIRFYICMGVFAKHQCGNWIFKLCCQCFTCRLTYCSGGLSEVHVTCFTGRESIGV